MAIKWGSTYVTVVKWGNTVCTQVKWGNTVVFPTGGYDGTNFSYPLNGGIKYHIDSNNYVNVTSGAISGSYGFQFNSSNTNSTIYFYTINNNINFTPFTKFKMTATLSSTSSTTTCFIILIRIRNGATPTTYDNIADYNWTSGTEFSFTTSITSGDLAFQARFNRVSGVYYATLSFNITKIEFY